MSKYWAKSFFLPLLVLFSLAVATSSLFAASIILVLLGIAAYLSRRSGWTTVCVQSSSMLDGASLWIILLRMFGGEP